MINSILKEALEFKEKIKKIKNQNTPEGFTWYGYGTLDNLWLVDQLLSDNSKEELYDFKGNLIADIGAADGDLGQFLAENGAEVDVIDWSLTNWNGLRGAKYLNELLGNPLEIYEVNLDEQFEMPKEKYDLVVFLGILYHLKNPFYVLEKLSKVSEKILVSTRIAQFSSVDGVKILDIPVAYLVSDTECNNDATNFWIFSEIGLKQLFHRSGWDVIDFKTFGDQKSSNPQNNENDERAFAYLKSRNF